jgi:hypothetical protein
MEKEFLQAFSLWTQEISKFITINNIYIYIYIERERERESLSALFKLNNGDGRVRMDNCLHMSPSHFPYILLSNPRLWWGTVNLGFETVMMYFLEFICMDLRTSCIPLSF